MTLAQAAYTILNTMSGGRSTDNEFRSIAQIKFTILYYRALFGRRELEKGRRTYEMEQTLTGIPVQLMPATAFRLPETFEGVYETPALPRPLRLKDGSGLVFIQNNESGEPIPQIEYQSARYSIFSRYTGQKAKAFEVDNKVGLIFHDGEEIDIRGVFEDPAAVHNFNIGLQGGSDFWDDDVNELPLPADLLAQIVQGIVSNELRLMSTTQSDSIANQIPDASQPSA